jgi:hypothetical protein
MPAVANVVILDGETTPVSHTFEPAKTTADYVLYEDRDAGIYIGNKKLVVTITRPQGNGNVGNRNVKVNVRLEVPRLENVSNSTVTGIAPAPTVAYRHMGDVTFTCPERGTKQERINLRALFRSALGHAQVMDAIDNLAVAY